MERIYLIQGVNLSGSNLWSLGKSLHVALAGISKEIVSCSMFSGLVIIDEEQQGGCVTNKFVPLTNFKIGDNELSFSKEHYGEKLDYIFTKNEEEGIWIGNYYHGEELLGPSKCVVTQIKKDFFYKPKE